LKLAVSEFDVVQRLELFAEVLLQRGAVADVGAVLIFQVAKFRDKVFFKLALGGSHCDHLNRRARL